MKIFAREIELLAKNAISGTVNGDVVVPSGASCTLSDVTVTGGVRGLQNGSLTVGATQQPATITRSRSA